MSIFFVAPFFSFLFCFVLFFFFFVFTKCFSLAKMTKNFNQEMYVRIKAKKNEPLFAFKKRVVRVVAKRTPATPATSVPEVMRVASLATSVEELTHT